MADQAANMKKAFKDTVECTDDIISLTERLIEKQRQADIISKRQENLRNQLEKEIENMNRTSSCQSKITEYMKRDQVLLEIDELTDELSKCEEEDESTDSDNSLYDVVELSCDLNDTVLAYLPCAAHNIQLVVKDGFKLDDEYNQLIERVSRNIVSKTKITISIAEELRKLDKSLSKSVITRWNSTLFMIRSVLSISETEFKALRAAMKAKTQKQGEIKNNFKISGVERDKLIELEQLLAMFKRVTNELQGTFFSLKTFHYCI